MNLCWHIHHDVLAELISGSIEERIDYIRANKPEGEVELRLRLMRPVRGLLPERLIAACRAYEEARRAFIDAWRARYGVWRAYEAAWWARAAAGRAYVDALRAALPEIEALHREECPDCPWDGKTIFPRRH